MSGQMYEEDPDLEWLISYTPPIPRADLEEIQRMLSKVDPFVPGVLIDDPYDVVGYLPRQLIHREEFTLLVDRNVVTRWVGVASGQQPSTAHRKTAAIMAFAHAADFLIEPNLALYELAAHVSSAEARAELSLFYRCLNAPTAAWADVALGRTTSVTAESVDPDPVLTRRPDLKQPLYRWRRNYILALKLAELHLQGGNPIALVKELMDWMYRDFLIGGPALLLSSFYLAPGAQRRGLLKGIESPDRERAVAGVRNAAWDLTLVSEWLKKVAQWDRDPAQHRIPILCSLDGSVLRLARSAVSFDDEPLSQENALFRTFEPLWGVEPARELAMRLHRYQSDQGNTDRALHQPQPDQFIDDLIKQGESVVRSWAPPRPPAMSSSEMNPNTRRLKWQ